MAKKNETQTNGFSDSQWINYDLNDKQKVAFKKWLAEGDVARFFERIDKAIEKRYTVSLKWDERSNGFSCFLIAKDSASPNFNCILAGRGRTTFAAIGACLFRHYDIFNEVWPVEANASVKFDDD